MRCMANVLDTESILRQLCETHNSGNFIPSLSILLRYHDVLNVWKQTVNMIMLYEQAMFKYGLLPWRFKFQ